MNPRGQIILPNRAAGPLLEGPQPNDTMTYPWNNKVCLVTGASSGLGAAITRALASRQATVLLNGRSTDRLQRAVDLLQGTGCQAHALPGDITSHDDVEAMARQVEEQFGAIDLLINCAGLSTRGRILDTKPDDFQRLWEINFLGTVRMTRAFASGLVQRGGSVVNIGSLASKVAPRYLGAYPASKFPLAAYSQQLRLELGDQGLHVLLVCPGPIARDDPAPRYADQISGIPEAAQAPGGGAKLRGIDPDWLAERILTACERRERELVIPAQVRWLVALAQLSPRLGDWLLSRATSGT